LEFEISNISTFAPRGQRHIYDTAAARTDQLRLPLLGKLDPEDRDRFD